MSTLAYVVAACLPLFLGQPAPNIQGLWVATWATSPEPANPDAKEPLLQIEDQTVRERVRVSIGGSRIRLRLSNEYGREPLRLESITVAEPVDRAAVRPDSIRSVTFSGVASVTIPPGAFVLSDPVSFPVAAQAEISVSLYFPRRVSWPTLHEVALKRAIVSPRGDQTRSEKIDGGAVTRSSISLTAVLVPARPAQRLVVAFGDSITDGDRSTVDADRTWPFDLARRLGRAVRGSDVAVVNEGIAGNRLLADGISATPSASALARFDRDALGLPGVTHVIVLEGVNDIGFPGTRIGDIVLAGPAEARTAGELIGAYLQLISRAHARGVRIVGGTILPYEGTDFPGYYSQSKEVLRQAVNEWIRTSGSFDHVIDFDAVLRDPGHPSRLAPQFAASDHLHPNDAGYQAMADAVDPAIFD